MGLLRDGSGTWELLEGVSVVGPKVVIVVVVVVVVVALMNRSWGCGCMEQENFSF